VFGFGGTLARHRILQRLNREGALWVADLHQSPNPERSLGPIVAVVSTHRKPMRAQWVDGPDSPWQHAQNHGRDEVRHARRSHLPSRGPERGRVFHAPSLKALDTTWHLTASEATRTEALDRKSATLATFASLLTALTATLGLRFVEGKPSWWALPLFTGNLVLLGAAVGLAVVVLLPREYLALGIEYLRRFQRHRRSASRLSRSAEKQCVVSSRRSLENARRTKQSALGALGVPRARGCARGHNR